MNPTFAWCFDHGTLHQFVGDAEPWCTAAWVLLAASTEGQALEAKDRTYGPARFFDDLMLGRQVEVVEACEARNHPTAIKGGA